MGLRSKLKKAVKKVHSVAVKPLKQTVSSARSIGRAVAKVPEKVGKATGNDTLAKWGNSASKLERGIVDDASANTQLALSTTSRNDGILRKKNRAAVTRQNPGLQAKIQGIGMMVGATGIPIASQIGYGAAAIAAARQREAGLTNNRQFGTSLAGAALGAYGPQFGGGATGGAIRGGISGGVGAAGSGQNVLQGALTGAAAGGAGGYLGGMAKTHGINPALARTGIGAVTGGIRGGSEGAYAGALGGMASGVGGQYGGRGGAAFGGALAGNYIAGQRADKRREQMIAAYQQRQRPPSGMMAQPQPQQPGPHDAQDFGMNFYGRQAPQPSQMFFDQPRPQQPGQQQPQGGGWATDMMYRGGPQLPSSRFAGMGGGRATPETSWGQQPQGALPQQQPGLFRPPGGGYGQPQGMFGNTTPNQAGLNRYRLG